MSLLKKYLNILKCPNTGEDLHINGDFLTNKSGDFKYGIYDDNFIELLPKQAHTVDIEASIMKDNGFYYNQLQKNINLSMKVDDAWGQFDKFPLGYQNFIKNEINLIQKYTKNNNKHIAIDISGGVGTYTFELAKQYDLIIHFDLDDKLIIYAYKKAKELGINNVLFVRGDRFNFPFKKNIANLMICIDSFIYYGIKDDKNVINNMYSLLDNEGIVFVDFHHSKPIFHNRRIHEYTSKEINYLKENLEGKNKKVIKFCSIPTYLLKRKIFQKFEKILTKISCFFVRWIIIIKK